MLVYQNKKFVMYSAAHVVARDGYSEMTTGYATMKTKSNITIYEKIF